MSVKFCRKCRALLTPKRRQESRGIYYRCPRCDVIYDESEFNLSPRSIPEVKAQEVIPFSRPLTRGRRNLSILPGKNEMFPFDNIRSGQKEFLDDCSQAFDRGMNLVAYAPTGIGKTVGSLVPALKSGLEKGKTIFFLTSKQSQHKMAVDTLRMIYGMSRETLEESIKKSPHQKKIKARGHSGSTNLIVLDIISKQNICPRDFAGEFYAVFNEFCKVEKKRGSCPYAKQKKNIVYRKIEEGILHVEELASISKSHMMCPHATALEVASYAHVVICDYNYLFSDISDSILDKLELVPQDIIAIVDEAHNLPDRIRGHMGEDISIHRLGEALSELQEEDRRMYQFVEKIKRMLADMFSSIDENAEENIEREIVVEGIQKILGSTLERPMTFREFYTRLIELGEKRMGEKGAGSSLLVLGEFFKVWDMQLPGTLRYISTKGRDRLCYRLLDPSVLSRKIFAQLHSSVLMSGTLFPPRSYADVLGLAPERTVLKTYTSPFPRENRQVYVIDDVSTLYKKRTPEMLEKITDHIQSACECFSGNLAVFFPSYSLLEDYLFELGERGLKKPILEERRSMSKSEKERVLRKLARMEHMGGAMMLGVQGGSFSEGVDYPGNLLQMVIVVGVPLAPPSIEVNNLVKYYKRMFGVSKGYKYSYLYPALSRVLQSLGRCIRDENDRGVILLLDSRFQKKQYGKHFPGDMNMSDSRDYIEKVRTFFGKTPITRALR